MKNILKLFLYTHLNFVNFHKDGIESEENSRVI